MGRRGGYVPGLSDEELWQVYALDSRMKRLTVWALLGAWAACALAGSAFAQEEHKAWLIRLAGVINEARVAAVKRNFEQARLEGAQLIILELDTPGGLVSASQDLGDFILTQQDMRIVAYINTKAYSGGTMVALACHEIYIDATRGMMGDVAPVVPTGQEVGEKFQSPIREILENYAEARGYPIALVQAMVTKELEVWRVQVEGEPQRSYLTGEQLEALDPATILGQPEVICPAGQLLTLRAKKAVEFGFARKAVTSRQALYDELAGEGATLTVKQMHLTASERIVAMLDTLAPLLLAAGLILLWHEITHPGFGLPGILGIACLVTLFMVKYSLNYAHMLEILVFVAGLTLLIIELFFIPGFGVVGAAGVLLLVASVVLMFQQFTIPRSPSEVIAFQGNILQVLGAFVVALIGMVAILRYAGAIPLLNRLVRSETLAGATVGAGLKTGEPALKTLVGQVGVALTPLRPAGRAEFGDRLVDVVTEGGFVERGTSVEAVAVQGRQVTVKVHKEA